MKKYNYSFAFARTPKILFGPGSFAEVFPFIKSADSNVLLVTGADSYLLSPRWDDLRSFLKSNNIVWRHLAVRGEPSPDFVDDAVAAHRDNNIGLVVAWGGGSVMDAGKAVSAMLREPGPVKDYLEGVGTGAQHSGGKVPFIAIPTTAGTGSEATKNTVLCSVGPNGFKKSMRHENFVPDVAVVDPELMLSCPPDVTAACGMDALAQLLESYVSIIASPMSGALALSGLEAVRDCLVPAYTHGASDLAARTGMAYAALMSGISLANAGLCAVHELARPLGGFFSIPHGVACGTLLAPAMQATIEKLLDSNSPDHPALKKFARAGAALCDCDESDTQDACDRLIDVLFEWTDRLNIPRLGAYGITEADLDKIVAEAENRYNPVPLDEIEMKRVLFQRL